MPIIDQQDRIRTIERLGLEHGKRELRTELLRVLETMTPRDWRRVGGEDVACRLFAKLMLLARAFGFEPDTNESGSATDLTPTRLADFVLGKNLPTPPRMHPYVAWFVRRLEAWDPETEHIG